jgi:TRAP-type C4-dicarboxylate transport system permease small subunit
MYKYLMRIKRILTKSLEAAVIVLVAALVLDVLWGVFSRYILGAQSRWTEELATTLLIWVSLLGASVACGSKAHLGVDYFTEKLHPQAKDIMEVIVNLLVMGFALVAMVYGGIELVSKTLSEGQVSPSLGIKVGYVYLALPISGAFIAIFCIETIVEVLSGKGVRNPQPQEGH